MRHDRRKAYVFHRDGWKNQNWPVVYYKKGGAGFAFKDLTNIAIAMLNETKMKYLINDGKFKIEDFVGESQAKNYRLLTENEEGFLKEELARLENMVKNNK